MSTAALTAGVTVPVGKTSLESFRIVLRHSGFLSMLATILIAVSLGVPRARGYLTDYIFEHSWYLYRDIVIPLLTGLYYVEIGIVALYMMVFVVVWMQRLLLADPARRTWSLFFRALLWFAVYVAGISAAAFALGALAVFFVGDYRQGYLVGFLAVLPIVVFGYYTALIVPAFMCGQTMSLREAILAMRGNAGQLFLVWLLNMIVLTTAGAGLFYGLVFILNKVVYAPHWVFFGAVELLQTVMQFVAAAVTAASVVLFYRRLVRAEPTGAPVT